MMRTVNSIQQKYCKPDLFGGLIHRTNVNVNPFKCRVFLMKLFKAKNFLSLFRSEKVSRWYYHHTAATIMQPSVFKILNKPKPLLDYRHHPHGPPEKWILLQFRKSISSCLVQGCNSHHVRTPPYHCRLACLKNELTKQTFFNSES